MTGGHLAPGNDLVGRPTKTVRTDNNNINCCGATAGSEQQHNQDLKEIYKGR